MKRILLTVALFAVASVSFGQKNAVKEAEAIAKGNGDFSEARSLIKGALENADTKDDVATWYVAGFIESQQYDKEFTKQMIGQKPEESVMYDALAAILPYYEKAYSLDMQPDQRGRVRPKYAKRIKGTLSANRIGYRNGGAYYYENKDYKKAYEFFNTYAGIGDLEMFKGESVAVRDTSYMEALYFAAISALLLEDTDLSISALERSKEFDFNGYDVHYYLVGSYDLKKDTLSMENVLKESIVKYPDSTFFMQKLTEVYIHSGRNDDAIAMLDAAISKEPNNAVLYDTKGRIYEIGLNDNEKAKECYVKSLEIDPENGDVVFNLGRVYYNQGIAKKNEASLISDAKTYQEENALAEDLFRKALPYFEKVRSLNPDHRDVVIGLRNIYYNLNMGEELDEIEKAMSY